MPETREFQERIGRIEGLVHKLESVPDPAVRTAARELMQAVMELHSTGLERMLETVAQSPDADNLLRALSREPLLGSLLILYDLHPDSLEDRVARGIEQARSAARSAGASVDVVAADPGLVHVRIVGEAGDDLREAIRDALYATAPDVVNVVIEGGRKAPQNGFVPLDSLLGGAAPAILPGAGRS